MKKNIIKFILVGSVLTLALVGCDNKINEDKKEIKEEISLEGGKTEKPEFETNDEGLEVFNVDFTKHDKIKIEPKIENEQLSKEEFIVFTYSETCQDCLKGAKVISDYVKSENSLPIYVFDYTKENNSDTLNYLISKGFNFTNLSSWSYFKDGVLYKSEIGNIDIKNLPLTGDYKNLKPVEVEIYEDSNNKHTHDHESHSDEEHNH